MKRRAFIHTVGAAGAAAAGGLLPELPADKLQRIGLELYAVRHAMARDPEGTLAAVRAIGYTDVELLWSLGNFGRTTAQVAAALQHEGLRAPSAHVSPAVILVGWERSLETAKVLGHQYLIVPSFTADTTRTIDDWLEWADRFNAAGAVARRAGLLPVSAPVELLNHAPRRFAAAPAGRRPERPRSCLTRAAPRRPGAGEPAGRGE